MRIKEVTENTINEFLDTDPFALSEEDTARVLAVTEQDFSQPMTGEQLMAHCKKLLGVE